MPHYKLDETHNLIDLFEYTMGLSDVPPLFSKWAMISTLAATAANRIALNVINHSPTYPNLYVFLIGPSGCGKGLAIDHATRYLQTSTRVNLFAGKTTAEYLRQWMDSSNGNKAGGVQDAKPILLLHEELKASIGDGEVARQLVALLTELFTGRDVTLRYGTITRGEVKFRKPNINWLAGTTMDWLIAALTKSEILSGFLARIITVEPTTIPPQKAYPAYPIDCDQVEAFIADRLDALSWFEGLIELDPTAREIHRRWVEDRPMATDPALAPTRRRAKEIVLKVAIALALADFDPRVSDTLLVTHRNISAAQRLLEPTEAAVLRVVTRAYETTDTSGMAALVEYIKQCGSVTRPRLTLFATNRGIGAQKLRDFIQTLQTTGQITATPTPNGWVTYTWAKRKVKP